ncbi:MAG: homoserine dehydrogenase [Candidatus Omnitrophica bacterium]|nr:homoserine dehydrogenase [Candidatus Omnitrophota bacterium]
MRSVNIGLIGAGTIGGGVIDLIDRNGKLIFDRTGIKLFLKKVCDKDTKRLATFKSLKKSQFTSDHREILNDKDIDIVIELIGGINPAKEMVLKALGAGKHVVTANKALLSDSWDEIFDTALKNKVFVNFEASVGGAIPIIRCLKESFVTNNLELVYGILNGTTNFILTMMDECGYSFDEALKIAQSKGIAEKNPALDISGGDSAQKLAIILILGFGVKVSPKDIFTEGIENITPLDIQYAKNWGYVIKLLAIAKRKAKELQLRVHPALIPGHHLLSGVKGEDNAVFVRGDFIGDSLLYGKGAGSWPTASSVVSDVVDIAKHVVSHGERSPATHILRTRRESFTFHEHDSFDIPYYLRFSVIDKPGVLAKISTILARNNISIERMYQEVRKEGQSVPLVMLTHNAVEGNMKKAISEIDKIDVVTDKTVVIRIEE